MPLASPPQSAHPAQRARGSPWGGVGSRVRVPAKASRRPASGLSASPGERGEEGRSLGSRSARLPAPRSPHGRLRCRQQVALRSVPFCRRDPRFAPSIFWNWPATAAIHFLKPGQRVELQPNSICRYQEQRRKENRELLRRQGANRRVKCPACPHTAELKRDPSSARPHPRQDASGQHSVLCASVVGGRARRPRRGLSQEAATVEGMFSPRGLGAFSCALSFQLKPCVLREGLRSFCY